MRRLGRLTLRLLLALAILAVLLGLGAWALLRASLPRDEGAVEVAGISGPVTVERDARGVPTIRGGSFEDVVFGLGFVHAQERFLQMDLTRRYAAGRLTELLGPGWFTEDRHRAAYDHERAGERHLAALPAEHRRLLERYAAGVDAGLDDLGARPPAYLLLRKTPAPWRPLDTMLVGAAFHEMLSYGERAERPLLTLEKAFPPEVVEFLTPDASRADALPLGDPSPPPPLPIPGPELVDLRDRPYEPKKDLVHVFGEVPGSNNWAVTGTRTAHGGAILAGDPHLQISVPGVWFRAGLEWRDGDRVRRAVGATAPGLPGVVIGATDAIAWSMTNFFGDHEDIVPVEVDPDDRSRYRAPDGFRPFETRTLPHPDGRVELVLRTTVYGPIVFPDNLDPRPLALASTALRDGMTNLGLLDLHHVDTLEEALDVGARWYGPSQNLVVAAADGRIGWVVTGCFPKRRGFDGKAPRSWADGEFGWDGLLDESARPRAIVEDGVLFSANGRMLPLERARLLTRCWAPSDRQRRIEELLAADGPFAEADFRAMQLDVDLAALAPFRDVFLEVVPEGEPDPTLARYRAALVDWDGTAAVDQRAVGVLLAFQAELRERVLGPVLERAREVNPGFVHTWMLVDEPLFRLLEERPAHFLPANVPSWTAHLRAAADAIGRRREGRPPLDTPWGERNRLRAAHPFARSLPAFLAGRLAAPAHPQPGTTQTVRVAAPAYGASLRLVASPGHLDEATMHLPIGQSGHPLSPHLMDAHEAWAEGRAEPLLAGPPVSTFTLAPR